MADLSGIKEHMEIIGADGVHVGTVDKVDGDRIKMIKADSGSHGDHHHYVSGGLVAGVEGNKVRLSANAANAALLEEEEGGEAISDGKGGITWTKVASGAAAVGAVAAVGAAIYSKTRGKSDKEEEDSEQTSGA